LRSEIFKHYSKLKSISGLSIEQIRESEFLVYKNITFISEQQIKPKNWQLAFELVKDIDPNDTPYIAYCKQFRCKLWSGDKKLIKGLQKKGFKNCISTNDLFDLRTIK
jgi:predicted nucleic acid-binding protein